MVEFIVHFISMLVLFAVGVYTLLGAYVILAGAIYFDGGKKEIFVGILVLLAGFGIFWIGCILSPFKIFVS